MIYTCSQCGNQEGKWRGRCTKCGVWNCIKRGEVRMSSRGEERSLMPVRASEIAIKPVQLIPTGIPAWDKALRGGMGVGSVLCAGEQGVGKTTHVIYAACHVAAQLDGEALFLSGEMPEDMVATMGHRLGANLERMLVLETDSVDTAEAAILQIRPVVVVVDSLQAFLCQSGPDGVAVEVCRRMCALGLQLRCQTWLISQLNKDGEPEGRRKLQHTVDTVMQLEKDLVRVGKNRFAPGMTEEPWFFGEVGRHGCEKEE